MKEKKVFIFDWDGTLLNSTESGYRKMEKTIKTLGLNPLPRTFLKKHWGMKADKLSDLILNTLGSTTVSHNDFWETYHLIEEEYPSINDTYKALISLKDCGNTIGLITSRTNESWLKCCAILDFDISCFDFIQTACHFYHHKPSGRVFEPLFNWVKNLDYTPVNIVYFGDTIAYDLKATRDLNPPLDFVAVASGVNSKTEFLEAGVDNSRIINSYNELPSYLNRIVQQKVEV